MSEQTKGQVNESCFGLRLTELLNAPERSVGSLSLRLGLEMGALLALPLIAITVAMIDQDIWSRPSGEIVVGLIKIWSIIMLGVHTYNNAPDKRLRAINSILMGFLAVLLTYYLADKTLGCPNRTWLGSFPCYPNTIVWINILAFSYMGVFLIYNIYSLKNMSRSDQGSRLFTEAFLFAVNIPSAVAFGLIMVMYFGHWVQHPQLFLSGAMAFLIFVTTAASICMDHYAKPFELAGGIDCDNRLATTRPGTGPHRAST